MDIVDRLSMSLKSFVSTEAAVTVKHRHCGLQNSFKYAVKATCISVNLINK